MVYIISTQYEILAANICEVEFIVQSCCNYIVCLNHYTAIKIAQMIKTCNSHSLETHGFDSQCIVVNEEQLSIEKVRH